LDGASWENRAAAKGPIGCELTYFPGRRQSMISRACLKISNDSANSRMDLADLNAILLEFFS
jgi:hypothetical protein